MRLIEGLDALHELDLVSIYGEQGQSSHSVVAVGVFDGVHLGHQRLLHQLLEMASSLQVMNKRLVLLNPKFIQQRRLGTAPADFGGRPSMGQE